MLSQRVLVPSLYDKAFLRYWQKRGPRHDIMRPFGYVIPACLRHCGTVAISKNYFSKQFQGKMSYSKQFFVPSNEGSDAEVSEDHHQPTAAYGWGREPRYAAEELPSRVTNVEEEDASAAQLSSRFVLDSDWWERGKRCIAIPSPRE